LKEECKVRRSGVDGRRDRQERFLIRHLHPQVTVPQAQMLNAADQMPVMQVSDDRTELR
jgi:hypothetical protein